LVSERTAATATSIALQKNSINYAQTNMVNEVPTRLNAGHDTRVLQAYLGHKNIQHTVRYTELSPDRFRDFWRD
jgi:site-specific recombinase XerC